MNFYPHQRPRHRRWKPPYLDLANVLVAALGVVAVSTFIAIVSSVGLMALTGVLIILKAVGAITFGWAWVFAPFWIPPFIIIGGGVVVFAGGCLINLIIFLVCHLRDNTIRHIKNLWPRSK